MIQLVRDYFPNVKTLNLIAFNVDDIIEVLKKPEFSIETTKGLYTALVKFLRLLGMNEERTKRSIYKV